MHLLNSISANFSVDWTNQVTCPITCIHEARWHIKSQAIHHYLWHIQINEISPVLKPCISLGSYQSMAKDIGFRLFPHLSLTWMRNLIKIFPVLLLLGRNVALRENTTWNQLLSVKGVYWSPPGINCCLLKAFTGHHLGCYSVQSPGRGGRTHPLMLCSVSLTMVTWIRITALVGLKSHYPFHVSTLVGS